MSSNHLSPMPMDPYQWRESVLSTRSLSYLSVAADALGESGLSAQSRNPSLTRTFLQPRTRRNTTHSDDSDNDLEMGGTRREERELNDIPELPDSVANCGLFNLPREIRDKIYGFCLTAQGGLPVEWPQMPTANISYALQPQLLRTCKIIFDETAPLLYTLNQMTFHHPSDANMFVRAFASTALSRRHITNLSLHIKSADTRLWMPYLTSTDEYRSLKSDFPALRELGVRYRSNKWNHSLSPDQNLRNWSEDNRLDEIIDGLRHVYYPPAQPVSRSDGDGAKPLNEMSSAEFMRFIDGRRPGEDMAFKRQLLELHEAHAPAATLRRPDPPTVKVVCACRVHSAHFNVVTSGLGDAGASRGAQAQAHQAPAANGPAGPFQSLAAAIRPNAADPQLLAQPVKEGEPFRGFSVADFGTSGVKRLSDPDLGSAKVARTPFADRKNVFIALELHTLDLRREHPGITAAA